MALPNADYENAEVQFGMGLKFASGKGVVLNYVQAAEWYRKAAEQNHSLAQFNLGMMFAHGQGVAGMPSNPGCGWARPRSRATPEPNFIWVIIITGPASGGCRRTPRNPG